MADNTQKGERRALWTLIVEMSAVVSCVGGLLLSWIAIKVSREAMMDAHKLAVESGSLDKPNLSLFLGPCELMPKLDNKIILGIPETFNNRINIGSLPFVVTNNGKKSAKGVEIIDQFPKFARSQLHDLVSFKVEGLFSPSIAEVHPEMKEIGNSSYFCYILPSLNPDHGFQFSAPFMLNETQFEGEVDAKTKDNKEIRFRYAVKYGLIEQITISAEDQKPRDFSLTISVSKFKDENDFLHEGVKSLSKDLIERRSKLSFPTSLLAPLEASAILAQGVPKLLSQHDNIQLFEVTFPKEKIQSITAYNKPNRLLIILDGAGFLFIVTISIALLWSKGRKWMRKRPKTS